MQGRVDLASSIRLAQRLVFIALFCSSCLLLSIERVECAVVSTSAEDVEECISFSQSSTKLAAGQSLEQTINGRDVKRFTVELAAGEAAQVLVKWLGLDLDVVVIQPDGAPLFATSIPVRGFGPVPLLVIADRAGDYTLEVRTVDQAKISGNFEITCSSIRFATESDRNRFEVHRVVSKGNQQKTRAAAITSYVQALSLAQSSADPLLEAYVLQKLTNAYISNKELRNAETSYASLIELRQRLNDRRSLAYTLREIGSDYRAYDSPSKAISYYQQTLSIAREIRDRQAESAALYSIGFAHQRSGRLETALEFYEQARVIQQERTDRLNEARTLNAMGGAYNVLGDQTKALDFYSRAASTFQALDDAYREAIMLNNVGLVYDDLGHWQEAKNRYQEAILKYEALLNNDVALCRTGSPSQTLSVCNSLANTTDNIGELYNTIGDPESALQTFSKTLAIRKTLNQPQSIGSTLSRICYSHILQGKLSEALNECTEALSFNRKAEDLRGSASTLTFLGMTYTGLNKPDEATRSFEEAIKLQRETGERRGEGITLNQFGLMYVSMSQPDKALAKYDQALKLWRGTKDEDGETITLYNIARLERDRGNLSSALSHLKPALEIIESRRATLNSQKLTAAYFANKQNHYELQIDLQMLLANERKSEEFVSQALVANEHARARQLLDALGESRILNASNQRTNAYNSELENLIDRRRKLQARLRSKANSRTALLGRTHKPEELSAVNADIARLTDEFDQLESQIRTVSPVYASFVKPTPLTVKEIQAALDQDTLLLEYALGEKRSYVFAVTNNAIKGLQLEPRVKIEAIANRLVLALTERNREVPNETFAQRQAREEKADTDYVEAATQLSKMIIEPVASQLGQNRLVIVADGALQYVPFSALPVPESTNSSVSAQTPSAIPPKTLVANHEIITLPSASVLALQRRELANRKPAPQRLAILADPVFDVQDPRVSNALAAANQRRKGGLGTADPEQSPANQGQSSATKHDSTLASALRDLGLSPDGTLRRLVQSRTEASDISRLLPAKESLKALDFKANRATATSGELSKYQYVHFATHGILSLEHPELSGIALSMVDEKGQKQDGYLRLYEIYNLNLPAELVVLSACETGVGKQIRGEGLIALTRGFMYAGAKRVVASLWKVNDSATAALMAQFYKEMFVNKKRPPEALKEAQLYISKQKRWRSPYYWAGFVLQGEWR